MVLLSLTSQNGIFLNYVVITQPIFTSGFKDNLKVTGMLKLAFHVKLVWIWMQRPADRHLQDQPGRATCGWLTCKCEQELVMTWNGWNTPEENLGALHSVLP